MNFPDGFLNKNDQGFLKNRKNYIQCIEGVLNASISKVCESCHLKYSCGNIFIIARRWQEQF